MMFITNRSSSVLLGSVLISVLSASLNAQCPPFPSNDIANGNGCLDGCIKPNNALLEEADNFDIQLAVVQGGPICNVNADCLPGETCIGAEVVGDPPKMIPGHCSGTADKINRFQEGVRDALVKRGIPKAKIEGVVNFAQAIQAILDDYVAKGMVPIDVAIFGHGRAGEIKVGNVDPDDILKHPSVNYNAFVAALQGKIKSLTLYGCNVATGPAGQRLLTNLSQDLAAIGQPPVPVKAWTGTVYAVPQDNLFPAAQRAKLLVHEGKKKDIPSLVPAVSQVGYALLAVIVVVGGAWLFRRNRDMVAV